MHGTTLPEALFHSWEAKKRLSARRPFFRRCLCFVFVAALIMQLLQPAEVLVDRVAKMASYLTACVTRESHRTN